jgi:hypothetical protein
MGFLGGLISGGSSQASKDEDTKKKKPKESSSKPPSYWKKLAGEVQGSFKKGGKVKKTGLYKLHKNETVVPAKKRRKRSSKRR